MGLNNDQGGQANRQLGGNGAEPALAGGEWVEHTRASSKLAKNRRTAGLTNEGLGAGRLTHLLRSIRGLFPGNSQRQWTAISNFNSRRSNTSPMDGSKVHIICI